ncbi:TGF-beta-activated kinase 1 and MAP3K7-binding protein 1-like [Onthophagus taurus]|uniref:TGF-beta-activated kinase 1 and MAP3K7-binding protein 1-like n=1 Tax=Onthophagus taurus TaxID=166361 RepID=UPI0039BDAF5C
MRSLRADTPFQTSKSWTDDLPVCKQSGVGSATNQIYREDGNRQEAHSFEDRTFHYKFDDNSSIYALFDGSEGSKAVDFCCQRMPAELVFGQLKDKKTDEEIKEVLRQAFVSVEKGYMDSMYDLLAYLAGLQEEIQGLSEYEAYQKKPEVVDQIKKTNLCLSASATAAVALIHNNKLYVANVGSCRVLLCQTDSNGVLKVVQLSTDHVLQNEDEVLRLSQLGININNLRKCTLLGNQRSTRCFGNYLVKGGYKEFEDLKNALQEPIISEPDIIVAGPIDEACQFLILMSSGFYQSIEEATGTDLVNKCIAQYVVEQFREQNTLPSVAQAVVDKVVRLHHDWFMSKPSNNPVIREDITLLVRNFNFPMLNAKKSPSVGINSIVISNNTTPICTPQGTIMNTDIRNTLCSTAATSTTSTLRNDNDMDDVTEIDAYVDFTDFINGFENDKKKGNLPACLNF